MISFICMRRDIIVELCLDSSRGMHRIPQLGPIPMSMSESFDNGIRGEAGEGSRETRMSVLSPLYSVPRIGPHTTARLSDALA
jgi:hypothetical protein